MTPEAYLLVGILIGAILGGLTGWFAGRKKEPGASDQTAVVDELRRSIESLKQEHSESRNENTRLVADLSSSRTEAEVALKRLEELKAEHGKHLEELKTAHSKALQELKDSFAALSTEALKRSHPEFLRLATETLGKFQETAKGDLARREEAIAGIVKPLKEQLESYQRRLSQNETERSKSMGELKKHLDTLATDSRSLAEETMELRKVLSSGQARGRWGEETLRRVVEAAGLSSHCDFSEQQVSDNAKPDLVIHLPGERRILVDSKVPDMDFLGALEECEPMKRKTALEAHARKLKETIKDLAARDYPSKFEGSLDYVVLFLPAESLFSAALEGDRDLIIWAAEKQIIIATPASLIALLRSVAVSWQQHDQTENAREIAKSAQELYSRTQRFLGHFDDIRKGLERANDSYNKAVGSYERMVRPSGERLIQLGASGNKQIPQQDLTPTNPVLRPAPTEADTE